MRIKSDEPKILPYNCKQHPKYKFACYFSRGNQRVRRCFETREAAEDFKRELAEKSAHAYSTGERPLSAREFQEYNELSTILSPYGTLEEIVKNVCEWATILRDSYNETLEQAVDNYIACDVARFVPKLLSETAAEYMNLLAQSRSEAYLAQIRYGMSRFQRFFPQDVHLSDITKEKIQDWFNVMSQNPGPRGKPLGEYARYNLLRCVQIFFNYCKRRGYIPNNPAIDIERPLLRQDDPEFYSAADVKKLLNAAPKDSSILLFLVLALYGGFRVTEMLRMRWRHIDFDHYDVLIDASMTKTRIRRRVHLPNNAQFWLAPFKKRKHDPDKKVFPWDESVDSKNMLYASLKELCVAAGVKKITNGFRHSCATYTLAHIGDPVVVSDMLGNSPEILKRHYASLTTPSEAREFFNVYPKGA